MHTVLLNRKQFFEATQHLKHQKGSCIVMSIEKDKISFSMESGVVKEVELLHEAHLKPGLSGQIS